LGKGAEGVAGGGVAGSAGNAERVRGVAGEVAALMAGNGPLQQLNRRFRRKNKPTDVLSFPRREGGDIAISAEIAGKNARQYQHSAAQELKVLILHGMLHLAGYDHETDNGQMAKVEHKLRTRLKLPASVIGRATSPKPAPNRRRRVGRSR